MHVKRHEQRKDSIIYHCPLDGCERKYKDKGGLRAHIDKHYAKDGSHTGMAGGMVNEKEEVLGEY